MPIDSRHLPKRFGKTVRELRLAAELTVYGQLKLPTDGW